MAAKAKTDSLNTQSKKSRYTPERLAGLKPVQPGQVLNPAGRPKGSRHKLGEAFIQDMYAAWEEKGKDAIERVIAERPHEFIKSVASILPKEIEVKTTAVQELSDDDIATMLVAVRSAVLAGNGALASSGSETKARH